MIVKGGKVETGADGEAALLFGGAAPTTDTALTDVNSVYAMVKKTDTDNHVTYVRVSAGFADSKIIKVTINPKP